MHPLSRGRCRVFKKRSTQFNRTYAVVHHHMGFAFGRVVLFLFLTSHFRRRRKCEVKRAYLHVAAVEKDGLFTRPRKSCSKRIERSYPNCQVDSRLKPGWRITPAQAGTPVFHDSCTGATRSCSGRYRAGRRGTGHLRRRCVSPRRRASPTGSPPVYGPGDLPNVPTVNEWATNKRIDPAPSPTTKRNSVGAHGRVPLSTCTDPHRIRSYVSAKCQGEI